MKLARQAIFGDAVLAQCTPGGSRELPALPNDELNFLKEVMFDQFSQYWSNPVEFESVMGCLLQCCWTSMQETSISLSTFILPAVAFLLHAIFYYMYHIISRIIS